MDCAQVQSCLEEYEARELSGIQHQEIEKHLEQCASCRKTRQILEAAWSALEELPVEEPDPFAPRRFLAKLEKRTVRQKLSFSLAAASLLVVLAAPWAFQLVSSQSAAPDAGAPVSTDTISSGNASFNQETAFADLAFGDINTPFADAVFNSQQGGSP